MTYTKIISSQTTLPTKESIKIFDGRIIRVVEVGVECVVEKGVRKCFAYVGCYVEEVVPSNLGVHEL